MGISFSKDGKISPKQGSEYDYLGDRYWNAKVLNDGHNTGHSFGAALSKGFQSGQGFAALAARRRERDEREENKQKELKLQRFINKPKEIIA